MFSVSQMNKIQSSHSYSYFLFSQYQEEIEVLNQVARHRPRSTLVMGIQQENRQIRELQHENKGVFGGYFNTLHLSGFKSDSSHLSLLAELRSSLEEHQSALELIMSKYREQVFRLLMASKRDDPAIVTQLREQHTNVSPADALSEIRPNAGVQIGIHCVYVAGDASAH